MTDKLRKISEFLDKHHVLSLATNYKDEISVCSLFYAYSFDDVSFVVASSEETLHIRHVKSNLKIAGNVLLETEEIGKIQGVQFRGEFLELEDKALKKLYFKRFPYALVLNPKLWRIKVDFFKLTDNRLGFGKKIIWERP